MREYEGSKRFEMSESDFWFYRYRMQMRSHLIQVLRLQVGFVIEAGENSNWSFSLVSSVLVHGHLPNILIFT